jgi:ComF family protein
MLKERFTKWLKKFRRTTFRRGYTCDFCGREVFAYPTFRLCAVCESALLKNDKFTCDKCGRKSVTEGVCSTCKRRLPSFDRAFSPYVYHGKTAALINKMKNGDRRVACFFAEKMADSFLRYIAQTDGAQADEVLAICVPTTEARKKERGYNPAEELLVGIEETLRLQGIALQTDFEVLTKRRETSQQKHLSAVSREENVKGAYHVHKRAVCKGRVILLVDDILTTGATGGEIASLLFGAGARKVILLTAAALPEGR